jgi:membrane protease YdiL (CAAX protease family)
VNAWKNILISFSIISLACAIKNYFIYLWGDTSFFMYFSPAIFGSHNYYITPDFIKILYEFQRWIVVSAHSLVEFFFNDKYQIISILLIAPVAEEIIYRLPLFVLKNCLTNYIYWSFAITINLIFAHSHGLYGISLLPLFVLGMCCSWLIKVEKVFWPCFTLHFLYNFYSLSFLLYQSLFGGD